MSTTVSYKGQTLTTVSNDTKTLLTEGKYLEDDLTLVDVSGSGSTLITKNISENGTYNASSDSADGYSQVNVAVPNTYTNADEGKVVSDGSLVAQTSKNINSNGTHSTVTNNQVVVAVPNSYSQSDEGKVVSNEALVAQTAHADVTPTTSDQTIDTTLNNSLKVKGDANLVAGNIKKDVEIFGTTGSYEGGGGGSSAISLLDTITVPSNTRAVNIDLTDYQDYNLFFVFADIELTESDWIYVVRNGSSPSDGHYATSQLRQTGIVAMQAKPWNGYGSTSKINAIRGANQSLSANSTPLNNIYVYTYVETKYIKAGSVFKIYGGNYADM